jgi:orotidine-5'-phosphate decarboxylase
MTTRNFNALVDARWKAGFTLCINLDPEPGRIPPAFQDRPAIKGMIDFLKDVIWETADLVAAYKPNAAFYEACGKDGHEMLRQVIETIHEAAPNVPVIFDAKRADIGNTNEKYVTATFDELGCDAITVHPYLGPEAMAPFIDRKQNGIIVLVRTSNPGAGRYQDLLVDGRPVYQHIAHDVATTWNVNGNCGMVVGATYPDEMKQVRAIAPDSLILVPGIGAQGGDVDATVRNGMRPDGSGLLLCAGRSILYAQEEGSSPRIAAQVLHDQITAARQQLQR